MGAIPLETVSHVLYVVGTQIPVFLVDQYPKREKILNRKQAKVIKRSSRSSQTWKHLKHIYNLNILN